MGIENGVVMSPANGTPAIETKLTPSDVRLVDISICGKEVKIELHVNLTSIAKSQSGGTALMRGAIEEFKNECLVLVKELRRNMDRDGNIVSGGN